MAVEVELQNACSSASVPRVSRFRRWARAALADRRDCVLSVRIVDPAESAELNRRYRGKQGPTNVLAFPADLPAAVGLPLLGDIVICAELVEREAAEQGRECEAHWAHLLIHGVLHLLGFDHEDRASARVMEQKETSLLAGLGFPDPYH